MDKNNETSNLTIVNHLLRGDGVCHIRCNKNLKIMKPPSSMIVIHYTAGSSAMSSAKHLAASHTDASAHFVISRTGEIIQIAPTNTICAHCGESQYKGRKNLNSVSIGIELANAGLLSKEKNGVFRTWFHAKCENVYAHPQNGKITYWEVFPEIQIFRLIELLKVLLRHYPIRDIVGHSDITSRKIDPGPAFPMERILDILNDSECKQAQRR